MSKINMNPLYRVKCENCSTTKKVVDLSYLEEVDGFDGFPEDISYLCETCLEKYRVDSTESYRKSSFQMQIIDNGYFGISSDERQSYRPSDNKLVHSGSWIMIVKNIPVAESVRPVKWAVYWAVPTQDSKNNDGYSPSGRYMVDILVPNKNTTNAVEKVSLHPFEYILMPEDIIREEVAEGKYTLLKTTEPSGEQMNLELIEKGRSLTEDERSVIWSLQVDGLNETQACNEYFFSRHVNTENAHIWYNPHPDYAEVLEDMFGRVGMPLGS